MGSELLEAIGDPTPPTVRAALEVVAHHGHLSPSNFDTLSPTERDAISECVIEFMPGLAARILDGDRLAWFEVCGWLNRHFDMEATWNLNTLPEAERDTFRARPVSQESWRQLRSRARWEASPRRFRRDAYCPALRVRRGGQRTRRVRRVASSPRRARAPSHLGDDPEPDDDDHHVVLRRRALGSAA